MEVNEKPTEEFFKCVKVSLKHVLKHYEINQSKINKTVGKLQCHSSSIKEREPAQPQFT